MRLDAPIKELTFADGQTLKLRNDSSLCSLDQIMQERQPACAISTAIYQATATAT